jgi:DNA-binding beta-propeller fold protein YncE
LNAWGTEGGAEDQFLNPTGIALDESNGWVYVVDAGNNRVQKFDSRGNFLKVWGTSDIGDGQFQAPGAITVDESGSVYVADTGSHRVQKFDSRGGYLGQSFTGIADNR